METEFRMPIEIPELYKYLPHRFPFLMIDRVLEFEDGVRIVAEKNVTINEHFFEGHFPGRPLMPGVLILEGMAQMGAIFARMSRGGITDEQIVVLAGAESVRFRRQVIPGDTLRYEVLSCRRKFGQWRIEAAAFVGEERAADALLIAAEVPWNPEARA